MTSPIGSSSTTFTPLNSLNTNRNTSQPSTGGTAGNPAEQETVHPATPVGPLGHNINTTA